MQNGNHILTILLLVGVIQGCITVGVLYRLQVNRHANRLLAWIILLISLACFNLYILEAVPNNSLFWDVVQAIVPLVIIMPLGPLVYFYIRALVISTNHLTSSDKKHFYTVIFDFLPHIVMIVLMIVAFFGLFDTTGLSNVGDWIDAYNTYIDSLRWISLVVYLWFSYRLLQQQSKTQKETAFAKWAKRFILGFALFSVIWLLHLIPYSIPSVSRYLLSSVGWYPVYIPLVILVYWLGVNGYMIGYKTRSKSSVSTVSPTDIDHTVVSLKTLMEEEQWFLNPTLKLQDVVKHTGIPQKTISAVLNQHLGKSFNEYVNTYRIAAFKKRLLDPTQSHLTITGIAFECGFNSQATFQRVFKNLTQQTPKAFRELHK